METSSVIFLSFWVTSALMFSLLVLRPMSEYTFVLFILACVGSLVASRYAATLGSSLLCLLSIFAIFGSAAFQDSKWLRILFSVAYFAMMIWAGILESAKLAPVF